METFSALLALCVGNSPVNSPHKVQRRGAVMFSLICVWINDWVNNCEAGDLRRHLHSAPTGARNSSLGHPNMAEASLGKNFPKVIPSFLHVFNGWYLQGLVIWCVSLSRPQNYWGKQRHLARRGCDISSRDARISTRGCPKLPTLG